MKKIIVADSGSTKTHWRLIETDNSEVLSSVETEGINPFFHNQEYIKKILNNNLLPALKDRDIDFIFFYGAGCSSDARRNLVKNALQSVFLSSTIHVEHDLLAAARATCKEEPGIACILGTGSNSCYYDGKKIMENIPALGYVLGDEGSGAYIGKEFIKLYLYKELPKKVCFEFEEKFKLSKDVILEEVYSKPNPNRYLATFVPFVKDNIYDKSVSNIVFNAFTSFFGSHIYKYKQHRSIPIHFVGSVGFIFKDILEDVAQRWLCNVGLVIQSPIDELVQYHLRKK